jgi:hypothetical protein
MSEAITQAEQTMGFEADVTVNLKAEYRHSTSQDGTHWHRHVALEWEGGVLWLDMSDLGDHFCIDVRQFRGRRIVPTGVFGIQDGLRVGLDEQATAEAHGWPALHSPILLTDK